MHDRTGDYRIGRKSILVTILVNLVLFAIKFASGLFGRSQALIADAFHTASDILTSIAVLVGFTYASTPPDSHHPYGHGKAESVAAKVVSLVLIGVGFKIIFDSSRIFILRDFYRPHQIALWAVLLSIVVKEIQFQYVIGYGRSIQSTSLIADAWHHRSDALSSGAALVGIAGARLGIRMLDPVAGAVVGAFIVKIGFDIFHAAFDELLDCALPSHITDRMMSLALEVSGVKKVAELKARKFGLDILVDMTIELDKDMRVEEAHLITAKIRRSVLKNIAHAKEVRIHVEPFKG